MLASCRGSVLPSWRGSVLVSCRSSVLASWRVSVLAYKWSSLPIRSKLSHTNTANITNCLPETSVKIVGSILGSEVTAKKIILLTL